MAQLQAPPAGIDLTPQATPASYSPAPPTQQEVHLHIDNLLHTDNLIANNNEEVEELCESLVDKVVKVVTLAVQEAGKNRQPQVMVT